MAGTPVARTTTPTGIVTRVPQLIGSRQQVRRLPSLVLTPRMALPSSATITAATWARFAVTGSTPSRSHISRYSASPRAYASIVLGARPRSVQICSHVVACSCRPTTGHFSLSTTVPPKPSPKSVVAPRETPSPRQIPRNFYDDQTPDLRTGSLPLLRRRVILHPE